MDKGLFWCPGDPSRSDRLTNIDDQFWCVYIISIWIYKHFYPYFYTIIHIALHLFSVVLSVSFSFLFVVVKDRIGRSEKPVRGDWTILGPVPTFGQFSLSLQVAESRIPATSLNQPCSNWTLVQQSLTQTKPKTKPTPTKPCTNATKPCSSHLLLQQSLFITSSYSY